MTEWKSQANPKRYDLIAAAQTGIDDQFAICHKVYFFPSGRAAGINVIGRVGPIVGAETPTGWSPLTASCPFVQAVHWQPDADPSHDPRL